ncbi:MAG: hypothetical protein ACRD0P_04815 [Stackebrandtia sp.]
MNRVELARSLYDAIVRSRGVACLGGGAVEVSTQYAGGKVPGIAVSGPHVDVHVVAGEVPVTAVAERVHRAAARVLRAAADPREVRVLVTDVDVDSLDRPGRG